MDAEGKTKQDALKMDAVVAILDKANVPKHQRTTAGALCGVSKGSSTRKRQGTVRKYMNILNIL